MLADPSGGRDFISLCCQRTAPDAFVGSWKAQAYRLAIPELRKTRVTIRTGAWFPGTWRWETSGITTTSAVVPEDHPALITFTSGSTGIPKAAVRTHGFLLSQHRALAESMDFRAGETDLITLPVFVFANLASGMTSVLADTNLAKPGSPNDLPSSANAKNSASPAAPHPRHFFKPSPETFPHSKRFSREAHPFFRIY